MPWTPVRPAGTGTVLHVAERERTGERVEHALERPSRPPATQEDVVADDPASSRRSIRATAIWLAITGISLYLVAPSLLDVLGSWRDVGRLPPEWLVVMLITQVASFACLWQLQR